MARNPFMIGAAVFGRNDKTGGGGGGGGNSGTPLLSINGTGTSVTEGGTITFDVVRGGNVQPACTVAWAFGAPSGTGVVKSTPADYAGGVFPSGTASFAGGQTTVSLTVATVDDTVVQGDRLYQIVLSSPTGGAAIDPTAGTLQGTIFDNDGASTGVTDAWRGWTKKTGQNTALTWQSGVGDSSPINGSEYDDEEQFSGWVAGAGHGKQLHLDIFTSFMIWQKNGDGSLTTPADITNRIQAKKPYLQSLTNANVRICQTTPLITYQDRASASQITNTGGSLRSTYVQMWKDFAQVFKDIGAKGVVFRLGHEMNGGQYAWSGAYQTTAQYIALYKLARATILGVLPDMVACWNPEKGPPKAAYWPGDDVVDIVGVDWYNNGGQGLGYINSQTDFNNAYLAGDDLEPLGWGRWINFCAKHKKMLCVPEWGNGLGANQLPGNHDCDGYMAPFKSFLTTQAAAGNLMFETYFNNSYHTIYPVSSGDIPNSANAYKNTWSGHTNTV